MNSNKPFNGLTDGQAERLAVLIEELAEAGQAAAKVLRFGLDTRCHDDPKNPSGRELLELELGDVLYAMGLLSVKCDVALDRIQAAAHKKNSRPEKFLHHQDPE